MMRPPLDNFLGITFDVADCVELTRRYLEACGITMPDPRLCPDAWEQCERSQALVATYRGRTHIAAVIGPHLLEAKRGAGSYLMRIDRMRKMGLEFWRLRK